MLHFFRDEIISIVCLFVCLLVNALNRRKMLENCTLHRNIIVQTNISKRMTMYMFFHCILLLVFYPDVLKSFLVFLCVFFLTTPISLIFVPNFRRS